MGRRSFVTAIVSPRALLREGLGHILGAADFSIAAMVATVSDVLPCLESEERPILFVLDVSADQDHAAQVAFIRQRYREAHVVMLADHDELNEASVLAAFRSGAAAYFQGPSCDTFVKSLELVVLGETILPPSILSFILGQRREDGAATERASTDDHQQQSSIDGEASEGHGPRLSARERCVLRCLIEGHSNKTIARKNDIAEATVKVHVKAILRKIRVSNRTQAAIWAMNHDSLLGRINGEEASTLAVAVTPSFRPGPGIATANDSDHEHGQAVPLVQGASQAPSVGQAPKSRLGLG